MPCTSAECTPCLTLPRRESHLHRFLTSMTSDSRCRSLHCGGGHTPAGEPLPGNLPAGCSSRRLFRPNPGMKAGILSKGFVHHRIIPGVSEDSKSEDPLVGRGGASGQAISLGPRPQQCGRFRNDDTRFCKRPDEAIADLEHLRGALQLTGIPGAFSCEGFVYDELQVAIDGRNLWEFRQQQPEGAADP